MGAKRGTKPTLPREPQVIDILDTYIISPLRDEVLLRKKYLEEGLSPQQIAIQLGVSRAGVEGRLRRFGIVGGEAAKLHYLTAQIPYGWKKQRGKLVLNLKEQQNIERIYKEHLEGQSLHMIARGLNLKRIRSKNGFQWSAKAVSRVLKRAKKIHATQI